MDSDHERDLEHTFTHWTTFEIVYFAITGPFLAAALLEWTLWLSTFCYCLLRAFRKADNWSSRVLAVLIMSLFTLLRCTFLPIMLVTLPWPEKIHSLFPLLVIETLQWISFWSCSVLLTVPWLLCLYRIVVYPLVCKKKLHHLLESHNAPKVVVVMPVYKEPADTLWRALCSVINCDYPADCLHIFVSFDGIEVDELYLKIVNQLGISLPKDEFPSSIDVAYNGVRITISRFPHGGKRHCQKFTFLLIDKIYYQYMQKNDDMFILFIDSDCVLDQYCIQNFMYEMDIKPRFTKQSPMLAMTGVITCSTKKHSFLTLLQDMEYVHGQLYERSIESACGSVTCLPGALTILRFSAFRNMARFYFDEKTEHCEDLFDYGKTHLGEDRWLTHLFMLGAKHRYQIQLCTSAFCKTEAVQTFHSLLKQRRRWFLGFITNEVCMLTDQRLWRKYPLLCTIRFMQNTIRTTALLFPVLTISVASTSSEFKDLPYEFIALCLGLNWLMMLYFAICLHRWKAVLYPLMFVVNPLMNWIYTVYGVFTARERTWGGPRVDMVNVSALQPPSAVENIFTNSSGDSLGAVLPVDEGVQLDAPRRVKSSVG